MNRWPSLAATVGVLVAGFGALTLGTGGWTVWTAESARRQAVLENPRPLPDYPLRDSRGTTFSLAAGDWGPGAHARRLVADDRDLAADAPRLTADGRRLNADDPRLVAHARPLVVVDLIYTRCPTVCQAMGLEFRQLQGELAAFGWLDRVRLVSVTFDSANDDDAALNAWLRRHGAAEPHWRAARFEDAGHLEEVLARLGVVVIPEPRVGFVHNAAFYLIDAGRVVEILDVDDRAGLFEAIRRRLEGSS